MRFYGLPRFLSVTMKIAILDIVTLKPSKLQNQSIKRHLCKISQKGKKCKLNKSTVKTTCIDQSKCKIGMLFQPFVYFVLVLDTLLFLNSWWHVWVLDRLQRRPINVGEEDVAVVIGGYARQVKAMEWRIVYAELIDIPSANVPNRVDTVRYVGFW